MKPGLRWSIVVVCVLALAPLARADVHVHVVSAGESLSALATRYEVSVEDLRAWNALEDDTIRVGQELEVRPALRYTTVPGDTLGCIAQRYDVPLERILEDNPHVSPRRLEVGQTLTLRGATDPRAGEDEAPAAVTHRVARGDTLSEIALRYRVELDALVSANPELDPDRLRVGDELTVRPGRRSESVGAPNCGFIAGGVQLGEHPAYVLRNPSRSWATARTAARLQAAFDRVRRAHPRAARVRVHDLSLEGGGPIDDHRSHQSGRDVDVTYYQRRGCGGDGCPLEYVSPRTLDVRRQWTLFRAWLRRGDAEAIFVDYGLQEALYREARRRGATGAQLREWFQYPRGRWHDGGVIRHFPNHRDHFHIRFACGPDEPRCR